MEKIVIVGAGVAGVNAATKLVDNGYPGEWITIVDMGKDPYNRKPEEVMTGFLGCLLYTSPSPRDRTRSRMPSSA